MQFTFVEKLRVTFGVFHFRTQVPPSRHRDRFLEMLAGLLGLAAQRGGAQGKQHPHVGVDRTVHIITCNLEIAMEERLDLRQLGKRIPVVAVRAQVGKRRESVGVEILGLPARHAVEGRHELVIAVLRPATGRRI